MINLSNIKTILQVAGISLLRIQFDDEHQLVNAEYVFRGKKSYRQITYQKIVESLTIGQLGPPVGPGAVLARELNDLPGETLNNGSDQT